ncbi:MAG: DUF2235 domain-containing protein [Desulfobulbaceae bacterium]|nr:DUF2235 domain-containing protein [Desulfobulbaceae bacterium]
MAEFQVSRAEEANAIQLRLYCLITIVLKEENEMPKKIIICFDGTCNDPSDARQKRNLKRELKDASVSNIFKLHLLLGGGLTKGEQAIDGQKSFYYSGVGTYGNKLLQWFNAALAPQNKDVKTIINKAVEDLNNGYMNGDQVFVFGFSRGAAIARRFAAVINDRRQREAPITIRFLGVFDTVASIGWPNLDDDSKPISDVKFENCRVSNNVDEALHMLSLDEKRTSFQPTLMAAENKVTEVWFSGAHSDVGGGYRYDGLADISLQFLLDELTRRKLGLKFRPPQKIAFEAPEYTKLGLAYDDLAIHPNPLGKSHQQDRSALLEWTTSDRDLRVHLEDIPPGGSSPLPQLHYTVVQRIHGDSDYRPVALSKRTIGDKVENQVPHAIWRPDEATPKLVKGLAEHLRIGPPAAKKLEVGQSRLVTIYANLKNNRSYVYANKGEEYHFEVDMEQIWFDSGVECGPGGWDRDSEDFPWLVELRIKWMEDERPCPEAKWFELIGTVGKKEQQAFQVLNLANSDKNFTVEDYTGEFSFMANDLEDRYSNNLGYIQLTVTRKQ